MGLSIPHHVTGTALLLLTATPGLAGGQAIRSLAEPDAVVPMEFSQVRGVRELSDGRVLVTDWIEERLVMVDAGFRRAISLGRAGSGPQEYRLPAALWPMAGDSTLLTDVGNGRLIVVGPDGRFARTISTETPGLGSVGGIDERGRLYYVMPAWARGASSLPGDSLELFRMDLAAARSERVAIVKGSTPPVHRGPRMTPGFSMIALAPQDAWRVLPSGGVLIVRAGDYHLERTGPAGVTAGPSYRYQPEPTRPADRTAWVREFVTRSPTSGRGPDGGMGHSPPMTEAQIAQMVETNEFAATLPPFERLLIAPGGEAWVLRGRHAGADAIYDRFNPGGTRIGQVRLPAGAEVVALGQRHVYVVTRDADDLQHLARHPRP